jgi:hypothetical protein
MARAPAEFEGSARIRLAPIVLDQPPPRVVVVALTPAPATPCARAAAPLREQREQRRWHRRTELARDPSPSTAGEGSSLAAAVDAELALAIAADTAELALAADPELLAASSPDSLAYSASHADAASSSGSVARSPMAARARPPAPSLARTHE